MANLVRPQPQRPADLPDFENPPVQEVILGVQFQTLPLRTFHSGQISTLFPDLSEISEQLQLPPQFEVFGGSASAQGAAFTLMTGPEVPRYWFRSADKENLVQLQQDRLLRNWTRQGQKAYPRYEYVKESFRRDLEKASSFFAEKDIGAIRINQCEVTYVNQVTTPNSANPHGELGRIFRILSQEYRDEQGLTIEHASLSFKYVLLNDEKAPYARLYVNIDPAVQMTTGKAYVQLNLTVRGKPDNESAEAAFDFFDRGRATIVKSFASLTRPEMHKLWGRNV